MVQAKHPAVNVEACKIICRLPGQSVAVDTDKSGHLVSLEPVVTRSVPQGVAWWPYHAHIVERWLGVSCVLGRTLVSMLLAGAGRCPGHVPQGLKSFFLSLGWTWSEELLSELLSWLASEVYLLCPLC